MQVAGAQSVTRVFTVVPPDGYYYVTISAWEAGSNLTGPPTASVVVPVRMAVSQAACHMHKRTRCACCQGWRACCARRVRWPMPASTPLTALFAPLRSNPLNKVQECRQGGGQVSGDSHHPRCAV